jgi:hypothetical protein
MTRRISLKEGTLIGFAAAAMLSLSVGVSAADCKGELIVDAAGDKPVKLYTGEGKAAGEIELKLAADRLSVECNEVYGLVKIVLADERQVWIDRQRFKRVAGASRRSDEVAVVAKSGDRTAAATSGIGDDPAEGAAEGAKK